MKISSLKRGGTMNNNYLGFYFCITLLLCFGSIALLFTLLGEKGSILISGFNSLSKSQRDLYDQKKLVRDQRNSLLLWTLILGIGAILSYYISEYFGIIAAIIWFILFFKDVCLDSNKAFEKYRKSK